jgi:hypothetical protein
VAVAALGTVAVAAVTVVIAAVTVVIAAGALLVVRVIAGALVATAVAGGVVTAPLAEPPPPDSPVNLTIAAVRPASEINATTIRLITSTRQRGAGASRVRAAVPQRRHQS